VAQVVDAVRAPCLARNRRLCRSGRAGRVQSGQGATDAVVQVISEAKQSVHLAGYGFTTKPIAQALIAAHQRGVDVEAVLDKSNATAKHTEAGEIAAAGNPVRDHARQLCGGRWRDRGNGGLQLHHRGRAKYRGERHRAAGLTVSSELPAGLSRKMPPFLFVEISFP